MNKKEILANGLYRSRLLAPIRALGQLSHGYLPVLAYHRVLDTRADFAFDEDLISANRKQFRDQMCYLKEHYTPITFKHLCAANSNSSALPERPVIISFDDGFDDNYYNAFKILEELDIPATFYISTAYIGGKKTFWFDWVVYLIKNHFRGELSLDDKHPALLVTDERNSIVTALAKVLEFLKAVPDKVRLDTIKKLEDRCAPDDSNRDLHQSQPMSWDQVQEMSQKGMEIGSHSVSHPILSQLTAEQLHEEIVESKRMIEQQLATECVSIAYPVGGDEAYNDQVMQATAAAEYRYGCSYKHGVNYLGDLQAFQLKRLHVEAETSFELFCAMLAAPKLFAA